MLNLCFLQLLMLLSAFIVLAWPFFKRQSSILTDGAFIVFSPQKNATHFFIISLLTILTAITLYISSSQLNALQQWLNSGEQHYQLLVQYKKLGGVDGMIEKIKQKLAKNPNDAKGWTILGKLYLMKEDQVSANAAFSKAEVLSSELKGV